MFVGAAGHLLSRPVLAGNVSGKEVGGLVGLGAFALLAPAHAGADVPPGGDSPTRVVIGWSYQFPLDGRLFDGTSRHRAVIGADLLFRGGVGTRVRLGYRWSTYRWFAGAGIAAVSAGVTLSPEVGVKFAHPDPSESSSLHLLVRGEVEPDLQRVQAVTILLGWSFL